MICFYKIQIWLSSAVFTVALFASAGVKAQIISTFAGGIGDDSSATSAARLFSPACVTGDNAGNFYFAEENTLYIGGLIRKVSPSGIISRTAGNGIYGTAGDGGLAVNAMIGNPSGLAFDRRGNIFISDNRNNCMRKVDASGIITTIAGGAGTGYSGDGSIGTSAMISGPAGITTDTIGNVYFADNGNNRVRKIDTSGIITTVVGSGTAGFSGDGAAAVYAKINRPTSVACDLHGNLYIMDDRNFRVRMVNASGIITTIAGTGTSGFTGDGGAATAAEIVGGTDIKVDVSGNVYLSGGNRIRKINSSGVISTVAGNGGGGFSGDGGSATSALFNGMEGFWVDTSGQIFVADNGNKRIRKINTAGIVSTVAGGYVFSGTGDGMYATNINWGGVASFYSEGAFPYYSVPGIGADTAGNIYFTQEASHVVRKIDRSGIVTTIAGSWTPGFYGDGGYATAAELDLPAGVVCDRLGNIYIADYGNHHIRKISPAGIITTIAGGGSGGLGDGGPATAALISAYGVWVDSALNVYIVDGDSSRIRKVDAASGIIHTIAGTGVNGFSGDGGPATAAQIGDPLGVTVDRVGNVYIADFGNQRVRKIDTAGIITTFAGGAPGYYGAYSEGGLGDGGPATAAQLYLPQSVITDSLGAVYIADRGWGIGNSSTDYGTEYSRVRKVDQFGYIHTVAGNGRFGYSGDGGPATSAEIFNIMGLALDTRGNLYVGDNYTEAIRRVCCMTTNVDAPPVFTGGAAGYLNLCLGATTTSVNSFLSASDSNIGDTLRWTVNLAPSHGSAGGFTFSAISAGSIIYPTGLTYTPDSGFTGRDTFSVKVSDGLDYSIFTVYVVINTLPVAGTISAPIAMCPGDTALLTETVPGGSWSSAFGHLSISATGIATAISAGADSVIYTLTNGCGSSTTSRPVAINPIPVTGSVSGPTSVCVRSSITLTGSVFGGTWSSASSFVSVDAVTGSISGVASGTALISYTVSNSCGSATDTFTVTVTPAISAGTISGAGFVCIGGAAILSVSASGGTWSSGDISVATISSSGVVTGISAGGVLISYTVSTSCGTAVAISLINVTASSSIAEITGLTSVCSGSSITLADATSGGSWTSSTTSVATVSSTGVVSAVAAGVATISYTISAGCGVSVATTNITVNSSASAGSISGYSAVCVSASISLSSSVPGGSWSASNSSGTITAAGVFSGVSAGSDTVIYTVTNSCGPASTSYPITVYPAPVAGTISGASVVCAGASTTLSSTGTGGVWSSASPLVATVTSAGSVFGTTAGTSIISYTVTTGCGSVAATFAFNVNAPSAGSISGTSYVCPGATTALSSTVAGGTWSSSSTSVATISASGLVTGVATGSTFISYTVTGSCGTAYTSVDFSVLSLPSIASIGGSTTICTSSSSALTDATAGGTWSSATTSVATISSSGVVFGVSSGTAIITYTVTSACGSESVEAAVTVDGTPVAGTISGDSVVCTGATASLSASVSGGAWSSSSPGIASVNSAGVVSGISAGSATILYTVTGGCGSATATFSFTVNSASAGILSGVTTLCPSATSTLLSSVSGGSWSSSSPSVATVASGGVVTAVAPGTSVITYSLSGSCGAAISTTVLTVSELPRVGAIAGSSAACVGGTTSLTDGTSGGTWSSSSTSVATVSTTGEVYGVSPGTASISYTVAAACGSSVEVAVISILTTPLAGTISGSDTLCSGTEVTLTPTVSGGTWSSSIISVATVSASGVVAGVSSGSAVITYGITNICGTDITTMPVTVLSGPAAGAITGIPDLCVGQNTTLTDRAGGGFWSCADPSVATISSTGLVSGLAAGTTQVSYTVAGHCGSADAMLLITVNPVPALSSISGPVSVPVGSTISLADGVPGGLWASGNNLIATVSTSGVVSGVAGGSVTITYTLENSFGCTTDTTTLINVVPPTSVVHVLLQSGFGLFPNPTTGDVEISWQNQVDAVADVVITDIVGRTSYKTQIDMRQANGSRKLNLSSLNAGVYVVTVQSENSRFVAKLIVN